MLRAKFAISVCLLLIASITAAFPQDKTPAGYKSIRQFELALRTYEFGLEMNDPVSIIAAARLAHAAGPFKTVSESGNTPSLPLSDTQLSNEMFLTASSILKAGEQMLETESPLHTLIKQLRAEFGRAIRFPVASRMANTIAPGDSLAFSVTADANLPAIVLVQGDADAILHTEVTGSKGKRLCADFNRDNISVCEWVPLVEEDTKVEIKNLASVESHIVVHLN